MANVLIVGSYRPDRTELNWPGTRDEFEEKCASIGAELARRGHTLVVCSNSQNTADVHAARGAAEQSKAKSPSSLRYFVSVGEAKRTGPQNVNYAQGEFSGLNFEPRYTEEGWTSTYLRAAEFCQAVVTLGGSPRGAGSACYISIARGTPVVPVPCFGGVSQQLWEDDVRARDAIAPADRLALEDRNSDALAKACANSVERVAKHNPWASNISPLVANLGLAAIVGLLAAWFVLAIDPAPRGTVVPYIAAIVAAAGGMTFRFANDDAANFIFYSGWPRVARDATRVFGALFAVFTLIQIGAIQLNLASQTNTDLFVGWLSALGFATGYIVENVVGLITSTMKTSINATTGDSS